MRALPTRNRPGVLHLEVRTTHHRNYVEHWVLLGAPSVLLGTFRQPLGVLTSQGYLTRRPADASWPEDDMLLV